MLYRSIDNLAPVMREKALQLITLVRSAGYEIRIGETRRDLAVHMAYYSRSRMKAADVKAMFKAAGLWELSDAETQQAVTQTLDSYHIKGLAIDIIPQKDGKDFWDLPQKDWETIGQIGKGLGLSWGGDFGKTATKLGWDCPHFEWRG